MNAFVSPMVLLVLLYKFSVLGGDVPVRGTCTESWMTSLKNEVW